MAIDIASPGADEDALRDALAGRLGLRLLASGAIASPVAYLDLALPAGYVSFKLMLENVYFSAADSVSLAFSYDGGSTFLCDTSNFDSYQVNSVFGKSTTATVSGNSFSDSLMEWFLQDMTAAIASSFSFDIFPGSANALTGVKGMAMGYSSDGGTPASRLFSVWATANPDATIPPTPARANLMRLLPYGNGDCSPPTSVHTITAGSYVLWGVPTP